MKRLLRVFAALAPVVAFMPTAAAAQSKAPVVAVLAFDNTSFTADKADFDGIGKGIMDLLITDLASNPKFRVVDRERVQKILEEQNLTRSGAVSADEAVRLGKMFGACYSIYGAFMRDRTGGNTLTVHTTNNETGQIQNPVKVTVKGDDIMQLIADVSAKFAKEVDVKACPGTAGTRTGSATPASAPTQQSTTVAPVPVVKDAAIPAVKDAPASKPATDSVHQFAKEMDAKQIEKLRQVKLDARTMLLYSRALDAKDRKDNAKAIALFQQVVAKYPTFDPAKNNLATLQKSGD